MIEFKPNINGEIVVYNAFENGEETGKVLLTLDKTHSCLKNIKAINDETAEGLIRSALHAAANRNAYTCVYEPDEFKSVALVLGFTEKDGKLTGEIPFLLTGCCGCNGGCQ